MVGVPLLPLLDEVRLSNSERLITTIPVHCTITFTGPSKYWRRSLSPHDRRPARHEIFKCDPVASVGCRRRPREC